METPSPPLRVPRGRKPSAPSTSPARPPLSPAQSDSFFCRDGTPAYRRLELLGNGSQGTAYLVEDLTTGARYVLKKIFSPRVSFSDVAQNETAALCALDHPAVVKYYDSWYDDTSTSFMILMEHVDGETLKDFLRTSAGASADARPRVSDEQILDWATQLLLALEHMQGKKVRPRRS